MPKRPANGKTSHDNAIAEMHSVSIVAAPQDGSSRLAEAPPNRMTPDEAKSFREWKEAKKHMDCYRMCHEKLSSENELTNNRLSWNFAIQGFLFGAYALCLQTMSSVQIKLADSHISVPMRSELETSIRRLEHTIYFIRTTGEVVSLCVLLGAIAAHNAIWSIHSKFRRVHKEYRPGKWYALNTHGNHFPGLTGGGNRIAHLLGSAPLLIPVLLIFVWSHLGSLK
jgi:hypothetical protein